MFRLCRDIGRPIAIASPDPVGSPITVLIAGTVDGHLHRRIQQICRLSEPDPQERPDDDKDRC